MNLFSQSLLFISTLIFAQILAEECVKQNQCQCVYKDGTGYDLTKVMSDESVLRAITDQSLTFYYNPCADSTKVPSLPPGVTDDCQTGYSLCMFNRTGNATVIMGKHSEMNFKLDENDGIMQIQYPRVNQQKISSINLMCTEKGLGSFLYAPLDKIDGDEVHLTLFSKYACATQVIEISHHGIFYKLFFMLLTILFAYLFIGMLVNYFLIGARGYELIPNYDFWCRTWRSMKLFFIYVKNGCRVIPAEDSYDAI